MRSPAVHRRFVPASLALCCAASLAAFAQEQPQVGPEISPALPAGPPGSAGRSVDNAIPITPDMIRELARRFQENSRTQEEVLTPVASPSSRVVSVTFSPGAATSIVQTVKGYPTALSFFDNTGQPWPIAWDTSSNAAGGSAGNCNTNANASSGPAVEVTGFHSCVPVKGSNVLQITPLSLAPRGGMLVSLQGAPKPLAFLVVGGGDRYDADVSIRVADRGPNAKLQIDTRPGAPVTGAPYLNAMLAGVAPADARPLSVEGVSPDDIRAWRLGDDIYLRTRHTLMSPPWSASESGEGGVTIYALPATPVVLMSVDGRTVSAQLKD
jgi:intracellular multiplication protein IcmK